MATPRPAPPQTDYADPAMRGHDPEVAGEVTHLLGVLEDEVGLLAEQVPQLASKLRPVLIHYPETGEDGPDRHDANTEVGSRLATLCAQVVELRTSLGDLRNRTEL